jgi:zinc transporter ZupT
MKAGSWDRGTSAAGIIALAAVLGCFLVTVVRVIKSDPSPHTLDWLGFSGSIIGAIMTLAAAAVTWFAVQRQINEARADKEEERRQEEFVAGAMLP